MSVVPLVVDGDDPTVVTTPGDFDKDGDAILIHGMDPKHLAGTVDSSNVSYDLRVGGEYRDHRDVGKQELREGEEIVLHSGAAVILETEEFVRLPKTRFACVVPKVSLLQKGLSNTMSKVDPGYQGNLLITLFNLGKKTVTLARYDRCCSLCVFRVDGQVMPYSKKPKRIEGEAKSPWWRSIRDALERNTGLLMVVLILVTIVSILF